MLQSNMSPENLGTEMVGRSFLPMMKQGPLGVDDDDAEE